jgi:heat shock protein HslJ
MNNMFKLLFFITILAFTACNKDRGNVINSEWIATSITYEDGQTATPDMKAKYILSFEDKKKYRLQLDINSCGGEVTFKSKSVKFKNGMNCTEACCDSDFAVSLTDKLPQTDSWKIKGNNLIFENNKGLKVSFIKE